MLYKNSEVVIFFIRRANTNLVDVEFFFKCHGDDHQADDDEKQVAEAPPLHLIRPNIRQVRFRVS